MRTPAESIFNTTTTVQSKYQHSSGPSICTLSLGITSLNALLSVIIAAYGP